MINHKYCRFLILIMFAGICIVMNGCEQNFLGISRKDSDPEVQQSFEKEKSELKKLARECGIPDEKINNLSALQLIDEIKMTINNSNSYYGGILSDSEKKAVKALFSREPKTIKTINEYDAFIKKVNGRKIIILP